LPNVCGPAPRVVVVTARQGYTMGVNRALATAGLYFAGVAPLVQFAIFHDSTPGYPPPQPGLGGVRCARRDLELRGSAPVARGPGADQLDGHRCDDRSPDGQHRRRRTCRAQEHFVDHRRHRSPASAPPRALAATVAVSLTSAMCWCATPSPARWPRRGTA
jgi:hypothetical protein